MKEKNMYGKKVWGVARTTFIIGPDGKIQHIFEKVKPEGHAEEVLAYLKESAKGSLAFRQKLIFGVAQRAVPLQQGAKRRELIPSPLRINPWGSCVALCPFPEEIMRGLIRVVAVSGILLFTVARSLRKAGAFSCRRSRLHRDRLQRRPPPEPSGYRDRAHRPEGPGRDRVQGRPPRKDLRRYRPH